METRETMGVGIMWLIYYDKMSLGTTGSDFLAVEDDISIGAFMSKTSIVSFNGIPEVFNSEKNSNSNFHSSDLINVDLVQVEPDDKLDDDYLPKSTFERINNSKDNTSSTFGLETRPRKYFDACSTTEILESTKKPEITLTSDQCRLLFLRRGFNLRIAKT